MDYKTLQSKHQRTFFESQIERFAKENGTNMSSLATDRFESDSLVSFSTCGSNLQIIYDRRLNSELLVLYQPDRLNPGLVEKLYDPKSIVNEIGFILNKDAHYLAAFEKEISKINPKFRLYNDYDLHVGLNRLFKIKPLVETVVPFRVCFDILESYRLGRFK